MASRIVGGFFGGHSEKLSEPIAIKAMVKDDACFDAIRAIPISFRQQQVPDGCSVLTTDRIGAYGASRVPAKVFPAIMMLDANEPQVWRKGFGNSGLLEGFAQDSLLAGDIVGAAMV